MESFGFILKPLVYLVSYLVNRSRPLMFISICDDNDYLGWDVPRINEKCLGKYYRYIYGSAGFERGNYERSVSV